MTLGGRKRKQGGGQEAEEGRDGNGKRQMRIFFFAPPSIFFRAAPVAFGGSQARVRIGAVAAGLRHNHSNSGSKLHLGPTSHHTAMLDP